MKVNRLDRLILRGRDPWRPVSLLYVERMRYATIIALVVIVMGMGAMLTVYRERRLAECDERNQRAAVEAAAFESLVRAHHMDGNRYAEAAWRSFIADAKANPVPRCE